MVPAHSDKVSRVSSYSGYRHAASVFAYGAFTLFGRLSQNLSADSYRSIMRSEPRNARISVWPLPISLAATLGIDFSFSSWGYLDVSVHPVSFSHTMCSYEDTYLLQYVGSPIRKSAGRRIFAPHRSLSQLVTSFFGSQCQGIRLMLFLT